MLLTHQGNADPNIVKCDLMRKQLVIAIHIALGTALAVACDTSSCTSFKEVPLLVVVGRSNNRLGPRLEERPERGTGSE